MDRFDYALMAIVLATLSAMWCVDKPWVGHVIWATYVYVIYRIITKN